MPRPVKITLCLYALSAAFLAPALSGVRFPLWLPYHWHKGLHVMGAVLFLGNALVTGVWAVAATRTRSPAIVRFSVRILCWADVFFTGPGFLLTIANGVSLATAWGGMYAWSWLVTAIALLGVAGAVAAVTMPAQIRLWKLAEDGPVDAPLPAAFDQVMRRWGVWGTLATILPLVVFFLMVVKPRVYGAR